MSLMTLSRQDAVWVLEFHGSETQKGRFENRFNPDFVAQFNKALDEIEKDKSCAALVTTSSGKIYSNGLDLAWMGENPKDVDDFMASVHRLLHRVMFLPIPSIAAINGHAFAGGFMLALCHDYRVMREDRGYLCLNEIDLGMNLTHGMNALVRAKIDPYHLRAVLLTGKRFSSADALTCRLVDSAVGLDKVLATAVELGASLAPKSSNRKVFRKMKLMLYGEADEFLSAEGAINEDEPRSRPRLQRMLKA